MREPVKFLKFVSGNVCIQFGQVFDVKEAHKLTLLDIQLSLSDSIEKIYEDATDKKIKWPQWGLVGTLYIFNHEVGVLPMIPFLADIGHIREVRALEKVLNKSDKAVRFIYNKSLANYNKNANKCLTTT